jgi:hypothetical protein
VCITFLSYVPLAEVAAGFRYLAHVSWWMGAYLTYLELSTGKDKGVIAFKID